METVVGVGNIGFPSSPVFGINSNIAVRAKLAREMKVLSCENMEAPTVVSLLFWNHVWKQYTDENSQMCYRIFTEAEKIYASHAMILICKFILK